MIAPLRSALVLLACTLAGCATTSPSGGHTHMYGDQSTAAPPPTTRVSPEILALHAKLEQDYKQILALAYPDYHGITIVASDQGFIAYHPLFTGYEFASGPFTLMIQQWFAANKDDFTKGGITFVGISSVQGRRALPTR